MKHLVDNFTFQIFFVWALLRCFPLLKGFTNGHGGVTFQEFGQGINTRLQNL
jgi:hypothetical protein